MNKKFAETKQVDLHKGIKPYDVRPGDAIHINFKDIPSEDVQLWRVSPIGCEVLFHKNIKNYIGEKHEITLTIQSKSYKYTGLSIFSKTLEDKNTVASFRWVERESQPNHKDDKRSGERWLCSDKYAPTGMTPNPVEFDDMLYFKVIDISSEGLKLRTSMRNKFFLPKLSFEAIFTFPLIGAGSATFEIQWTKVEHIDGKEFLSLGVKLTDKDKEFKKLMGQYLQQFGPSVTPEELRASGLGIGSIKYGCQISYVKTKSEYEDVLKLRKQAYHWIETAENELYLKHSDEFDSRSRIMMAKHKGRIIGSLRMIFHHSNENLELEKFVAIPNGFPENSEIIEVTRLCTDPSFRDTDLLYALLQRVTIATIQANRRWIVGSTSDKMIKFFEKLGAKNINRPYTRGDHGVRLNVFVYDVHAIVTGKGINPLVWNYVGSDMLEFLIDKNQYRLSGTDKVRIMFYKFFKPLAQFVIKRKRRK